MMLNFPFNWILIKSKINLTKMKNVYTKNDQCIKKDKLHVLFFACMYVIFEFFLIQIIILNSTSKF